MSAPTSIWQQRLARIGKWLFSKEALTYLCCVAAAATLWLGHGMHRYTHTREGAIASAPVAKRDSITEKVFVLPIVTKGVPSGTILRLFPPKVTVRANVPMSLYEDLTEEDLEAYCTYPRHNTDRLPVTVNSKNHHITNLRVSINEVEYTIEEQ